MHSKGAKKSLKLGDSTNDKQRKYAEDSPGAHNPNYYVLAQNKNGDWLKSKIIECRLKRGLEKFEGKKSQKKNLKLNEHSYEYYIHYCHTNRRLDEWITSDRIKLTSEYIDEEKKRAMMKKKGIVNSSDEEYEGLDQNARKEHEEATKVKTIMKIKFGVYTSETWYYSPFPDGYHNIDTLYFCEFCLSFYTNEEELKAHLKKCKLVHPPGNQIYHDPERNLAMFEVDGFKNTTYCENLCYLAKLFLDHKLLYYTITPFLFYILTKRDETGYHIVGYFSKNKDFSDGFNLSCILTLPFHQRKGYGKLLINMSYELSKIEKRVGTPERPLSDLGRLSYLSYWTQKIIEYMLSMEGEKFNLQDVVDATAIRLQDVIDSLERVNLIKKHKGDIFICTNKQILVSISAKMGRKAIPVIRENLHWHPFKFKYEADERSERKFKRRTQFVSSVY